MKKREKAAFNWLARLLIFTIVVIAFNIFYWSHYSSLLIAPGNIIKSLIIIDCSFFIAVASIIAYKNLINPVSLYSLFIFLTGYSYIPLSNTQHLSYSYTTEIVLGASIVSFLAGCLLNRKVVRIKFRSLNKTAVRIIFTVILSLSIAVFALEIAKLGYIPIFNLLSGVNVYSETNDVLIPFAHYLVLFVALVPAIAYAFFKEGKISRFLFLCVVIISAFVILNFLSRQIILLLMLSLFYSYVYFNKISMTRTLSSAAIVVGMFIGIGSLRTGPNDVAGGVNEYLKAYAQIDKDVALLETYLTLYSSQNFTNLDKIVGDINENTKIGFGIYTFKPIISFLLLDRMGLVYYDPDYDGFMRLGTYVLDPFLDFSFPGVFLINFLLGFLCMNTYRSFTEKVNTQSIINWSVLSFCIIMSAFTNFYDTFFIWFALLLSIPLTNYKTKRANDIRLPSHP